MSCFNVPGDLMLSADERRILWWQGAEEIAARVNTKIQVFRGFWRYDQNAGVPWFDVLEKPADPSLLRAEIHKVIRSTPGIVRVLRVVVSLNAAERSARVDWSARTNAGIVVSYTELS